MRKESSERLQVCMHNLTRLTTLMYSPCSEERKAFSPNAKPLSADPKDWETIFDASSLSDSLVQSPRLSSTVYPSRSSSFSSLSLNAPSPFKLSRSGSTSSAGSCNAQDSSLLSRRRRILPFLKPVFLYKSIVESPEPSEKAHGNPSALTHPTTPNATAAHPSVSEDGTLTTPACAEKTKAWSPISALWDTFNTKNRG